MTFRNCVADPGRDSSISNCQDGEWLGSVAKVAGGGSLVDVIKCCVGPWENRHIGDCWRETAGGRNRAGGVERAAECHAGRVLQTQVEIFGIVRVRERSGPGAEAELGGDSLMDLASDGLYHGEIVRGWIVVT